MRLIDATGEQLGIKQIEEAQRIALEQDLDLVEVAPQASPPVCKIMDYSKFCYEQEQKQKAARKKQSIIVVKEMKMRPKIDIHDYDLLQRFTTEHGKMLPSRLTGASAKQQRQIRHAIRRARTMGLVM